MTERTPTTQTNAIRTVSVTVQVEDATGNTWTCSRVVSGGTLARSRSPRDALKCMMNVALDQISRALGRIGTMPPF